MLRIFQEKKGKKSEYTYQDNPGEGQKQGQKQGQGQNLQPQVLEALAYRPADYIAKVKQRRMDSYGDDVRSGEAAVLAAEERAKVTP